MKTFRRLLLPICLNVFPALTAKLVYKCRFGEMPNLKDPKTFNEKILVKILFDRNPKLTLFADKFLVRNFVKSRLGGEEYLTMVYGVTDNPDKIHDIYLPGKFVMKPNHLFDQIKIVYDARSLACGELEGLAKKWLKMNHYKATREWAYKDINPLIIFEELLVSEGSIPDDWKFFCFSGEPRFIQIDKGRFGKHRRNLYDLNLSLLPVRYKYENFQNEIGVPENFNKMLEITRKLSEGIDFVRVDLYNINGRIVFGELTNYPAGGLGRFEPSSWDLKFGSCWKW